MLQRNRSEAREAPFARRNVGQVVGKPFQGKAGGGLLEIVIAVTLLSIVLAAMFSILVQQQRFYLVTGDAAKMTAMTSSLESALGAELLPLNPGAGDVRHAGADSVALRVFRGAYAVCKKGGAGAVEVTARSLTPGLPLETDSALVYSQGSDKAVSDDYWAKASIAAARPDTCPDGSSAWTAQVPDLASTLPGIPIGAPVRVFDHASYWLARRDDGWFLLTDAHHGETSVVAGPVASSDSTSSGAVGFRYLDEQGATTSTPSEIARIDIDVVVAGVVPTRRGGEPLQREQTVAVRTRNAGH